jgi:hypothetical protein
MFLKEKESCGKRQNLANREKMIRINLIPDKID